MINSFSLSSPFPLFLLSLSLSDTVDLVVRDVQSQTFSLLKVLNRDLASLASSALAELFTDVGLFVLGVELNLEEAAHRFFHTLFPLVYEQLVEPGRTPFDPIFRECVRSVGRRTAAYVTASTRLASLVSRASLAERTFLQAMHLAVEVINTTDHAQPRHECRHALMRMRYCPLCRALTDSKPCMGYCLNVLRGCLAGLAEVDAHWQEFVNSLEVLAIRMQDRNELEHELSLIPPLITDVVAYASRNAARLTSQVRGAS